MAQGSEEKISLIAAIGERTRAIGHGNDLLWHLPEDLKLFKEFTSGHPVVMGRRTWESLPERFRPLPGRTNIVVTHDSAYEAAGAEVATTLEDALERASRAPGGEETFVIGGGQLYASALPFAGRLYLTLVDDDVEGDTFFPEYSAFTKIIEERIIESTPPSRFVILERE